MVNALSSGGSAKLVLITGVSRGLGRALALEMAKRGHTIVGCSRSQEKLHSLSTQLSPDDPSKHLFVLADVRSDSSVAELAKVMVDTKVNNAGTINKNNKIWEISSEEFDAVLDTNVKGTANILRHFLPFMIQNKKGLIVNLSSGWGRSSAAEVAPYCASKWAIEGLTGSVAKELPFGLAVVALNPGVINTDMLASCFGSSAAVYPSPESWAPNATTLILGLTAQDNGASLTV
ncbi:NADPH-dependent pterin aldehyde reductase isoform X2 [Amborella trichopoda]|uniref:NADPH-dependent pterin aldehyde reductase isoform X2 n=1 Tax=Amborella trichopoda TaxID=13333 RepID=UPI0005D2FAF5|nr:NADPH-dependent pterin aldehyde reductase isoform X2 [Amborella trichopoda]|eukprot:XP_011620989.1 NADPH-dependent pterin aldehyde reductase isoform X2 [Amborella trichopoda]